MKIVKNHPLMLFKMDLTEHETFLTRHIFVVPIPLFLQPDVGDLYNFRLLIVLDQKVYV